MRCFADKLLTMANFAFGAQVLRRLDVQANWNHKANGDQGQCKKTTPHHDGWRTSWDARLMIKKIKDKCFLRISRAKRGVLPQTELLVEATEECHFDGPNFTRFTRFRLVTCREPFGGKDKRIFLLDSGQSHKGSEFRTTKV